MASRLIVVSNRLPVSVCETPNGLSLSRSNGGLATALASLFREETSVWVGWTGLRRHLQSTELEKLAMPSHLKPINLTDEEITLYYDQFANGILWPVMHGLSPTIASAEVQWRAMQAVTNHFADAVETTLQSEDRIWIHDYHLLLLPGVLRKRGIKNRIGFFLHTPFSVATDFRKLPHNTTIFKSIMSVDILGVQTERDVTRLQALLPDKQTKLPLIKSFPIGIDFESFDSLNESPKVTAMAESFRRRYGKKTIILSMSRLDYTKGICTQLRAFEAFIKQFPKRKTVIYRLNVAPSRESVLEYRELKEEIEQLAAKINTIYGTASWQPVDYTYENIGLQEISAWYQVADIHLNVPVADGMNLIAKEYIAARRPPGVAIISNTMGAAAQLKEALAIPPENIDAARDALKQALEMTNHEKTERWRNLRQNVKAEHVVKWADDFISSLESGIK